MVFFMPTVNPVVKTIKDGSDSFQLLGATCLLWYRWHMLVQHSADLRLINYPAVSPDLITRSSSDVQVP